MMKRLTRFLFAVLLVLSLLISNGIASNVAQSFRRDFKLSNKLYFERWANVTNEGGRLQYVINSNTNDIALKSVSGPFTVTLSSTLPNIKIASDQDLPVDLDWMTSKSLLQLDQWLYLAEPSCTY